MIGIVTPYNIRNYGSKLQAFAVQSILSEYSDDVEMINYSPLPSQGIIAKTRKLVSPLSWYSFYLRWKDRKNEDNSSNKIDEGLLELRKKSIDSFDIKYKLSEKIEGIDNLRTFAKRYDVIIVGSDQVWNPINVPAKYTTLEFAPLNVKRAALAASFGVSEINPVFLKPYYRKFLRKYRYISVREDQGVGICKQLLPDINVVQIPDPTVIVDPSIWNDLSINYPSEYGKEKYCFCYFLGDNREHRKLAREFAKKNNMKIVSPVHFKKMNDADVNFADIEIYDVSPEKFIAMIRYADVVMTDSFHGSVFSIIFEKSFYTFERYASGDKASANSRIYNLLSSLGLDDRLVRNNIVIDCNLAIDYTAVKSRLDEIRNEAKISLDNMINSLR